MSHSGKRNGLTPHPHFQVINVDGDGIGDILWPFSWHVRTPLFLHYERTLIYEHSMLRMLDTLKQSVTLQYSSNVNITKYSSSGQRRRRASRTLLVDTEPHGIDQCQDNDVCVSGKTGLLGLGGLDSYGATCNEIPAELCEEYHHQADMLECCPIKCRNAKYDVSLVDCEFASADAPSCYKSDWCLNSHEAFKGSDIKSRLASFTGESPTCEDAKLYCDRTYDEAMWKGMMNCCAPTCAEEGYDVSEAPCQKQ